MREIYTKNQCVHVIFTDSFLILKQTPVPYSHHVRPATLQRKKTANDLEPKYNRIIKKSETFYFSFVCSLFCTLQPHHPLGALLAQHQGTGQDGECQLMQHAVDEAAEVVATYCICILVSLLLESIESKTNKFDLDLQICEQEQQINGDIIKIVSRKATNTRSPLDNTHTHIDMEIDGMCIWQCHPHIRAL